MDFVWNIPTQRFLNRPTVPEGGLNLSVRDQKRRINKTKKDVVEMYMKYYNELIEDTIKAHNGKIYTDLNSFLQGTTFKLRDVAAKISE